MMSEGDAAWLACDALGHVAVFTTAGEGPMPDWLGKPDWEAGEAASKLPATGQAKLSSPLPNPTWFQSVASAGIYAYDWSSGEYRLLAMPTTPARVSDLPAALAAAARRTVLPTIEFGLVTALNPTRLLASATAVA